MIIYHGADYRFKILLPGAKIPLTYIKFLKGQLTDSLAKNWQKVLYLQTS